MAQDEEGASYESLLQQAERAVAAEGAEEAKPPEAEDEVLRAQVRAFKERVLASRRVRRLIQKHRRRGIYAIRPWQWALLSILLPLALGAALFGGYRFSQATRARIALHRAVEAARERDLARLEKETARAVSFGYDAGGAYERVGRALYGAGFFEEALVYLDRASVATRWEDPFPQLAAVRIWLERGEAREALSRLRKAEPVAAHLPEFHLLVGRAEVYLGSYDAARDAFERALELDPNSISARYYLYRVAGLTGDGKTQAQHEGVLLAQPPRFDEDPEVLLGLAQLQMENGRASAARKILDRVLETASSRHLPDIYYTRGLIDVAEGRYQEALRDFGRAVEMRPHDPDFETRYAEVLYLLGRTEEAIRALRAALSAAPLHARARYDMGWILWADLGEPAQANRDFEIASSQAGDFPLLPYALGATRYFVGDYAGAAEALDRLPAVAAENPEVRFLRGLIALRTGRPREAEEIFSALGARGRPAPRVLTNLGVARELLGDTEGAAAWYWRAIEASPSPEEVDSIARANLDRLLSGEAAPPTFHEEIDPRPARLMP